MSLSKHLIFSSLLLVLMNVQTTAPARAYPVCGLVDRSGKEIIPVKYHSLSNIGNGLFYVSRLWDKNPYLTSYDGFVVDSNGREINVNTPPGYTLSAVFLPNNLEKNKELTALPSDAILQIHGPKGVGLADAQGKILVEAQYSEIWQPIEGKFLVTDETKNEKYFFDPKSSKLTNTFNFRSIQSGKELLPVEVFGPEFNQCGYLKKDGTLAIAPIFAEAEDFAPNGLAKVRLHIPDRPNSPREQLAYIDKTGKVVSPHYLIASAFKGDHAAVALKMTKENKLLWGIIDKSFKARPLPGYTELVAIDQDLFAGRPSQNAPLQAITADGTVKLIFPAIVETVIDQDGYFLCGIKTKDANKKKFIALDKNGKVIDENANFSYFYNFGLRVVQANPGKHGSKSHVEETNGKILIPDENATFSLLAPNTIYKIVDDEHFSQAAWRDPGTRNGIYRDRELAHLLKDYNLIGMTRAEIEKLLGTPDNIENGTKTNYYYSLQVSFCGNAAFGLAFDFDANGKVESYYIPDPVGDRDKQKKYTVNMVVDESKDYPYWGNLPLVEKAQIQAH